jgi:hypothetical protein
MLPCSEISGVLESKNLKRKKEPWSAFRKTIIFFVVHVFG